MGDDLARRGDAGNVILPGIMNILGFNSPTLKVPSVILKILNISHTTIQR